MNIIIERGKNVESLEDLTEYSIALDGFVQGPALDNKNHRYSFDHHRGCIRFCTTATCVQAWTAILGGLDPQKYTVYCNDVDIDVCMAIWCLKNPDRCTEPLVRKLVEAVGLGDMHAGAIPLNGMAKIVDWVAAPQTDSRKSGDYEKLSDGGLMTILESILHRATKYVDGEASADIAEFEVQNSYEIKRDNNGWALVESHDPHIYSKLYRAGFDRIVLVRPQEDGSNTVSLVKRTDFIDNFPLEVMYKHFNKLEKGWGGGSTAGGSPKHTDGSGTKQSIDVITEVVDAAVENRLPELPEFKRKPRRRTTKKKATKKTPKDDAKK